MTKVRYYLSKTALYITYFSFFVLVSSLINLFFLKSNGIFIHLSIYAAGITFGIVLLKKEIIELIPTNGNDALLDYLLNLGNR
jgi:hypothetical protein